MGHLLGSVLIAQETSKDAMLECCVIHRSTAFYELVSLL